LDGGPRVYWCGHLGNPKGLEVTEYPSLTVHTAFGWIVYGDLKDFLNSCIIPRSVKSKFSICYRLTQYLLI